MQAERKHGPPVMAVAARPLWAARWPRFDLHVAIQLAYVDSGNSLPADASLDQKRATEGDMAAVISPERLAGRARLHRWHPCFRPGERPDGLVLVLTIVCDRRRCATRRPVGKDVAHGP